MTQLLQDVFVVENLQILTEGTNKDTMKIKGVFGRCNEKNNNGRIYPTSVLEGQLNKVQPLISERRLCGELDHPQNDTVRLSNASHLITKLEMKGNELVGEAEILKTPAGLTAKALVEGGVKIGISSRGMGTLSEDAKGDKIVNEDFRLVTFDLVADPSTRGAFPGLSESTQSQFVRESQTKLEKEQNFITLLQSKLRDSYDPWIEEATKKKKKTSKKSRKEGPTDDGDGMDPVGQGDADIDNDGDTDSSDAYLTKRREAIGRAMKAEGTYYRIGSLLAEAFADEVEKTSVAKADAEGNTQGPSFMDRRRVSAGKKSAARADVKAAKIRQSGEISLARRMEKAKERAAAGKPVTGGERAADLAKKAGGKIKAVGSAVKDYVTDKRSEASQAAKDRRSERRKNRIADRLAGASSNKPTPEQGKGEAPKKKSISPEEKAAKEKAGRAQMAADTADVKRRAGNKSATSASMGRKGSFGAGVGAKSSEDEASREATRKSIARREKKTGKKVKLTSAQATQVERKLYRQIGLHLAEAFGLVEK
tara:strand:+ start:1537 stop:3150 length:1614 start_codon:yes stop_codon:yes gene_type:complete